MSIASCAARSRAITDKIRDGREPQDRQGARAHDTPVDHAARRRGDRVSGSATPEKTIAIVRVCRWTATVGGVPPVRMMSGCRPTNSRANARIRLISARPHRTSIRRLPIGPTQARKRLNERRSEGLQRGLVFVARREKADAPHAISLLRARRERPSSRAAEERDEVAAIHSIISSAMARSCGGTSMPSSVAVPRLMTKSNLTACWTGSSAGLAPLRMLPVYTPT